MNRNKRLVKSGTYLPSCRTSTKIILVPYSPEYAILQREAFMIFFDAFYSDSTVVNRFLYQDSCLHLSTLKEY